MGCPCLFRHFPCLVWLSFALGTLSCAAQPPNLVVNGSFEQDADNDGVPDDWATAGRAEVEQRLTLEALFPRQAVPVLNAHTCD